MLVGESDIYMHHGPSLASKGESAMGASSSSFQDLGDADMSGTMPDCAYNMAFLAFRLMGSIFTTNT